MKRSSIPGDDLLLATARSGRCSTSHMKQMAEPFCARLLEATVTAQQPTLWKWEISEHSLEVMCGFETSRETAQIQRDSALFMLLSERPS